MKYFFTLLFIFGFYSDCEYTWMTIGDSITYQDEKEYKRGPNKGEAAIGYQTVVKKKIDTIIIKNKGFSGLALTSGKRSLYSNVIDINYDGIDLVTIFCGTNDFKLNKPIGEISRSNFNEETFIGAFNNLINKIKISNPKIRIVLLTPLQRDNDYYSIYSTNEVNHKLNDYVNAIKNIGDFYNLQVVDFYEDSDFTFKNLNKYSLDGLHPNNRGYEIIGRKILQEIFNFNN